MLEDVTPPPSQSATATYAPYKTVPHLTVHYYYYYYYYYWGREIPFLEYINEIFVAAHPFSLLHHGFHDEVSLYMPSPYVYSWILRPLDDMSHGGCVHSCAPLDSCCASMRYYDSRSAPVFGALTPHLIYIFSCQVILNVPKCEIFDRSDFIDCYTIKPFWFGDFGAKIGAC